jgi:hypothetical protein
MEGGRAALRKVDVLHDRRESYWAFGCRHALCHAYLHWDWQGIWETTGQSWTSEL